MGGNNLDHAPSVGNGPGAIAFTRIFFLPHSAARERVSASTPPFAEADGTTYADPVNAYVVTMFSITPAILFSIQYFPRAREQLQVPFKTISITASNAR